MNKYIQDVHLSRQFLQHTYEKHCNNNLHQYYMVLKKEKKTLYNKLFVKATFKSTQADKNSSTLYDSLSIKNLLTALLNLVPLKFFISAGSLL